MRDPLHWLDVKRKLALTFVGVCLVAFGVGGSLAATSASRALEEEIVLRLRYQCRAWAEALDADLSLLTRRCEDFASDGYIRERAAEAIDGTDETAREDLRRHLAANKLPLVAAFAGLSVIDGAGAPVTNVGEEPPAARIAEVAGGSRGAQTGPWQSGLVAPEETAAADSDAAPLQAVVVPLRSLDGTRVLGRLVAWVRTDRWVEGALRSVEGRAGAPAGTTVRGRETIDLSLADVAGRSVSVRRSAAAALGGPQAVAVVVGGERAAAGSASAAGPDPSATIDERVALATNGWTVRVRLHDPHSLAPVAGLQTRFLLVGVALALAIGAILFFPMRYLARPLVELREAARRLEGGDLAVRVESNTEDEIGDLARSFNHMAESVESRTRRLEDAARELAAQRDRLDGVIRSMRDGLVVLDPDGRPVLSNAAAKPLLEALAAKDARISSHERCDDAAGTPGACASCLLDARRGPRACVVDAGDRVLEVHAAQVAPGPDGRRGRVLVARDVTDRVARDQREIHQERLSVLGEVAAVMAHELNNPLAAISMFSQMTEQGLGAASPWREHLEVIRRNTETCKRTIRELLDYATGSAPELGEVDVHEVLRDVARFLRPIAERSNVQVALGLGAAAPAIPGDEIQVRQVFVNLVVNAVQAMGRTGGTVTLTTRNDGGHVVVEVADTGPGIPEDVRPRVFDAFFTTKPRGSGTGLGLPTARRIAELHGGGLELAESGPGRTVFRVRLRGVVPAAGATDPVPPPAPRRAAPPPAVPAAGGAS